jgi:hypothetical protein
MGEIKRRLNSGSIQNLLSSRLLSKNIKIKIYKIASGTDVSDSIPGAARSSE